MELLPRCLTCGKPNPSYTDTHPVLFIIYNKLDISNFIFKLIIHYILSYSFLLPTLMAASFFFKKKKKTEKTDK